MIGIVHFLPTKFWCKIHFQDFVFHFTFVQLINVENSVLQIFYSLIALLYINGPFNFLIYNFYK